MPSVLFLAIVGLVWLSGCAASGLREEGSDTRAELRELQRVTGELRREVEEARRAIALLREGLGEVRAEVAHSLRETGAQQRAAAGAAVVAAVRAALRPVAERIEATERRLDALAESVSSVETSVSGLADQVARLEAVPPLAVPVERPKAPEVAVARPEAPEIGPDAPGGRAAATAPAQGPEELFERGMARLRAGELGQAILDLEEVADKHPSHPLGASARFWIADAYFRAREYQHAAGEYQKAIEAAPAGEKTPEALLKLGLAHRALRRDDRARDAWTQLIREFPDTDAARRARRELARLPRTGSPGEGR
jgi:tol-pal system protein YbgF